MVLDKATIIAEGKRLLAGLLPEDEPDPTLRAFTRRGVSQTARIRQTYTAYRDAERSLAALDARVEAAADGRVRAVTSVERVPDGRLFNSLRLRRFRSLREVAT